MLVLETGARVGNVGQSQPERLPTFSQNVSTLYRKPPERANRIAHFATNLVDQQQPLAVGLERAVKLVEAELRSPLVEKMHPRPNQFPLDTLARLSSSLSTIALGTRVFNQFYENASHHTEHAANNLEAAIAAHGSTGTEFGYAYTNALTEIELAKTTSTPSLLLDSDTYAQVIQASIEHCGAVLDGDIEYQAPHPDAVFLPFAVIAASAALPNNARLHAAATSAASMAKVIASAKFTR